MHSLMLMSRFFNFGWLIAVASLLAAGRVSAEATTPGSSLTPDVIIAKAVERAQSVRAHDSQPGYLYTKHTVTEDLDLQGRVKGRKEKIYEVSVAAGLSSLKLVQFNGQNLSAAELKKQEDREAAERQKMTDGKLSAKGGDLREDFLTADLVAKYHFALVQQKVINGRNAYELEFKPKGGLSVRTFTDRFANQIAGTVWIDAEDFEIARAEVHLQGEVALWGGMIGALKHCRYTLERSRMPDGVWFNANSHGIFEGRKLMEPMLIRTRSESSNFHHAALALQ